MLYMPAQQKQWSVAPEEHIIKNYDDPKHFYRQAVVDLIGHLRPAALLKKPFFTISTNVLCADLTTKNNTSPHEKDVYLPLEICITKWTVGYPSKRQVKFWMIDPGPPTTGSNIYAADHARKHKISFDSNNYETNQFIEKDLLQIVKDINAFLTPERVMFSIDLFNVRQDLGSLKWLNIMTNNKLTPIRVLSILDLYTVLNRKLGPEDLRGLICQGAAELDIKMKTNFWNDNYMCPYHRIDEMQTEFCARCISEEVSDQMIIRSVCFAKLSGITINNIDEIEQFLERLTI